MPYRKQRAPLVNGYVGGRYRGLYTEVAKAHFGEAWKPFHTAFVGRVARGEKTSAAITRLLTRVMRKRRILKTKTKRSER